MLLQSKVYHIILMLVPTVTLWQLSFSPVQFTADETQSHKSLGSDT